MFYTDLKKAEDDYQFLFNLKLIYIIQKNKVDESASSVSTNDDFIIIKLRSKNETSCPIDIYLGINKSRDYYNIYLNEKAEIYNYEKFENFEAFEGELRHFLSNPIQEKTLIDKNGDKVYADYNVLANDGKVSFSFRRYFNETWTNFLGYKRTTIEVRNYFPWL